MIPSLAIAGISAAGSLIGDIIEANQAKSERNRAIDAFKKLLIPSSETESRADRVGDTIYTKAMSELNRGAFAGRGSLNPELLRTIAYSKMAPQRAEAELDVFESDLQYNREISQKMAEIQAQPLPKVNPMNAVFAGVEGYLSGEQLNMQTDMNDMIKAYYGKLMGGTPPITQNNTQSQWATVPNEPVNEVERQWATVPNEVYPTWKFGFQKTAGANVSTKTNKVSPYIANVPQKSNKGGKTKLSTLPELNFTLDGLIDPIQQLNKRYGFR